MDALFSLLGTIVVESGRFLFGSAYSATMDMIKFQENMNALEKEIAILSEMVGDIKQDMERKEQDGTWQTIQVRNWLRKIEEIEVQVSVLMGKKLDLQGGCLYVCSRYRMSRNAAKKLREVRELTKDGFDREIKMPTVSSKLKAVEQLPGPSIITQSKASENFKKALDLLKDRRIRTVGVWGMGGVGKTTLIRNLNNELGGSSAAQLFSLIIWVTVSKGSDMKTVQSRIAKRMNLYIEKEDSADDVANLLFSRLKKEKKFLLILDDVWERIDLEKVGVPLSRDGNESKILITTRSREVCAEMKTDFDMKIDVLAADEAWDLFVENAGEVVNQAHIKPIAMDVAKECCGLPLAIITVGRAMRRKTKVELWKDAVRQLRMSGSVPYIRGLEKEVFLPLKWSYDSLEGKNIKPCFLYCCLYPEDYSICEDELIQCWIAEGLIDEQEELDDAYNRGVTLIEILKSSCLLEPGNKVGTLALHDVVRDLAIWISNTVETGNKCLVRAGMGLSQIPEVEVWDTFKRVSFMENDIKILPDSVSSCSEASTLLLQGNRNLKVIPEGFLRAFRAIRVLNLSSTLIMSLPVSIAELGSLRVLSLNRCVRLRDLSSLQGLSSLEILDLSHSSIINIPAEMKELKCLRCLDLSYTVRLRSISSNVLAGLSSLEVLDMRFASSLLGVTVLLAEICLLDHLVEFCFGYSEKVQLELCFIKRLKKFFTNFGPVEFDLSIPYYTRTVFMGKKNSSYPKSAYSLFPFANACVFQCCVSGFREFIATSDPLEAPLELRNLQLLVLDHCDSFRNLQLLVVDHCDSLGTISCSSFQYLKSLIHVEISYCGLLTEIISGYHGGEHLEAPRKMKIMKLKHLPDLTGVCNILEIWPFIEQFQVEECPLLQKLPFSLKIPNIEMDIRTTMLHKCSDRATTMHVWS